MSLTSELSQATSPVSVFMRTKFPNRSSITAASRKQMDRCDNIRPSGTVPWHIIGAALDYRIRFYFQQEWVGGTNLVCHAGMERACAQVVMLPEKSNDDVERWLDGVRLQREVLVEFFERLGETINALSPADKQLEKSNENTLLRYCVVMAALDLFFRSGYDFRSILLIPEPKATLEELLAVAENNWLDDLRKLSWGFMTGHSCFFHCPQF